MDRPLWKPTAHATACGVCGKAFSFLIVSKQNCRACGEVVCSSCCSAKIPVRGYLTPEKACSKCAEVYYFTKNYPTEKVKGLCEQFKNQADKTNQAGAVLGATILLLDNVKDIVPAPFNMIVTTVRTIVSFGMNACVNLRECQRLAIRISRINFLILELTALKSYTSALRQCTKDLMGCFEKAVTLLEGFQGNSGKLLDRIKAKWQLYSSDAISKFNSIHEELSMIIQDTNLGASLQDQQRCVGPSLSEITVSVRNEIAHITDELDKIRQETGETLNNVQQQLQLILESAAFSKCPQNQIIYDPKVVEISNEVLGRGGFGIVYAGKLFGMTDVAIKVVQSNDITLVEDEIRRTMRVRHPNVVKIYGIVPPDGIHFRTPAVVMERLGKPLDVALSESVLPIPFRMKYTLDIISGMARVHDVENGVVHFDLKPANILLTLDSRTAKIIDFGISQSRTTVAMNMSSTMRGTIPFMAPELFNGKHPTAACDVYSFGVLLYELWTNLKAWKDLPDPAIISSVKEGLRPATDVELVAAGVSDSIISLISACWAQEIHDRPTFAQIMTIKSIENFYEAPERLWPSFLLTGDAKVSIAAATIVGSGRMIPKLPTGAAFVKFTSDQMFSVLNEQEIDPDICQWLKEKRLNGESLVLSGEKIISRLRNDTQIDELHVDSFERLVKKIVAEYTKEQENIRAAAELRNAAIVAAKQKEEAEQRAKEEAKRKADEQAQKDNEQRIQQERERAIALNRKTFDIWLASVNSKAESALTSYLNVVSESFVAHVTYKKDGNWITADGYKSGLIPHYRNELWASGAKVINLDIKSLEPQDCEFTYSVVYPSGYTAHLEARWRLNPPGILSQFDAKVL